MTIITPGSPKKFSMHHKDKINTNELINNLLGVGGVNLFCVSF